MLIDKPLRIAFLFSVGLHSILLSPLLSFVHPPFVKENTTIEVTYVQIKEERPLQARPVPMAVKEVTLKKETKSAPREEVKLPPPKETKSKDFAKKAVEKKRILKKRSIESIDLNALSSKDGHLESINYLRVIRNKISSFAHMNYKTSMGEGEALVYFVLNSDGSLESVSIIEDDLGENERLRALCLDSLYFSSPFNPFPKELDLPQAAFNILISFKRK